MADGFDLYEVGGLETVDEDAVALDVVTMSLILPGGFATLLRVGDETAEASLIIPAGFANYGAPNPRPQDDAPVGVAGRRALGEPGVEVLPLADVG